MNEFYEAVSNLFEELRCDSGEREYTVQPEEWKEAEKNLKQIQKKLPLHLEKIPEREQNFWNKYLDQLEHVSMTLSCRPRCSRFWALHPKRHKSSLAS